MEFLINFFTSDAFLRPAELLLRIVLAVVCGAFVGMERTNRGKEAGIRTHAIVALASCLMMIISQYGFSDFFENFAYQNTEQRLDPSNCSADCIGYWFFGCRNNFYSQKCSNRSYNCGRHLGDSRCWYGDWLRNVFYRHIVYTCNNCSAVSLA